MIGGLRTFALGVKDLAAAKAWYAALMGVEPTFDEPFYVGFDIGGYELGLHPVEGAPTPTTYFASPDPAAELERAVAAGATLVEPARDVGDGIIIGSVRDPFGHHMGFVHNPGFRADVGARIAATGAELSAREVTVHARIAEPVSEVWRRWTTEDGLASWFCPRVKLDLRIGGALEVRFLEDQPAGKQGSEGCRILSFLPERMLSFTWNAPPNLPTRDAHTWVVVTFEAVEGGTSVTLTHTGWPQAVEQDGPWAETIAYFEGAWQRVMGALEEACGALEIPAVQGVGGVFLYVDDAEAVASWYTEHLGIAFERWGEARGTEWPSQDRVPGGRRPTTTLAFFQAQATLPPVRTGRLNLRVADLEASLARLEAAGVGIEKRFDDEFGHFAQVRDPEGQLLELWQPPAG